MVKEELLDLYETMWTIRIFEETVDEMIKKKQIHGTTHLYTGEEAVAAGAVSALLKDDIIVSNHRNHGHAIAKTGDVDGMMAEMLGRSTGLSKGLGGSMHMADMKNGNFGSNGIVGAGIAIGAGIALAQKRQHTGRVTASFFGDGATNTGNFHETMNIAALMELPAVFICENNGYGISTRIEDSSAETSIAKKAEAYGIVSSSVDGNDVIAVHEAVAEAVAAARAGEGPRLVEAVTYRWKGHSKSDKLVYRAGGELEQWMDRCPIMRLGRTLREMGAADAELFGREGAARKKVARAVSRAKLARPLSWKEAEKCL